MYVINWIFRIVTSLFALVFLYGWLRGGNPITAREAIGMTMFATSFWVTPA